MFHHSAKLQYPVKVDKPNPEFAMLLQQAIGGVEGEIRVAMHQQQWLAVIEEMGGLEAQFPIPNSTPEAHEATAHSHYYLNTRLPPGFFIEPTKFEIQGH